MKRATLFLVLAALLVGGLTAGCESQLAPPAELTLQTKNATEVLPADAQMVMMVDLQALQRNALFAKELGGLDGIDARMQGFFDVTGFDPKTDLREVYMAQTGPGGEHIGVVAYATFDRERLQSYVEESLADELERASYQGATIYRTREADEAFAFAIATDNMIVAAKDERVLQAMLDRLAGTGADALKTNASLMALVEHVGGTEGAWMVNAVIDDQHHGHDEPDEFARLRGAVGGLALGMRIEETGVGVTALFQPDENVAASDLADLVKGAVAAAKTSANNADDDFMKMLDDVEVRTRGEQVQVEGFVDNAFFETER